mmetsp:Transcript_1841/g.3307  ORF Transcript_1841/g.3307 Transcript_1841/m.3307 type:complete len:229 (-) Transcript_1841:6-692(-)
MEHPEGQGLVVVHCKLTSSTSSDDGVRAGLVKQHHATMLFEDSVALLKHSSDGTRSVCPGQEAVDERLPDDGIKVSGFEAIGKLQCVPTLPLDIRVPQPVCADDLLRKVNPNHVNTKVPQHRSQMRTATSQFTYSQRLTALFRKSLEDIRDGMKDGVIHWTAPLHGFPMLPIPLIPKNAGLVSAPWCLTAWLSCRSRCASFAAAATVSKLGHVGGDVWLELKLTSSST